MIAVRMIVIGAAACGIACSAPGLRAGDDIISDEAPVFRKETVRFERGHVWIAEIADGRLTISLGTTFDQQVFGRSPHARLGGRAVLVNGMKVRLNQNEPPPSTSSPGCHRCGIGEAC